MRRSEEKGSRRSGRGAHRREVTVGFGDERGEGRETVEMSCRECEWTREIQGPEANASRPEGLRSAADKLLRLGGPGRIELEDELIFFFLLLAFFENCRMICSMFLEFWREKLNDVAHLFRLKTLYLIF